MTNFRHLQAFLAIAALLTAGIAWLKAEPSLTSYVLLFATTGMAFMSASQTMHLKQGFRAFSQIVAHASCLLALSMAAVSLFIPFQAELMIGLCLLACGLGHGIATYLPLLKRQKYLTGKIKFFNTQNMFGFVKCEGIERDIFVHLNSIDPRFRGRLYLDTDVEVDFVLTRNEKGLVAARVRPARRPSSPSPAAA